MLAIVGWNIGMAATDRPHTSLGGERDRVHAWVTDPDAELLLYWSHWPSGTVDLMASLGRQTEVTKVVLLLQCNARLQEFENLSSRAELSVENKAGEPEACDPRQVDDREAPVQIVTITFRDFTSGLALLRGTPHAPWSDEAAGERVSHAPFVSVGGVTNNVYFDEKPFHAPHKATVSTTLHSSDSEVLESHFPTDMPSGLGASGRVYARENRSSYTLGPSVTWQSSWSAEEMRSRGGRIPYYQHTYATAHWSDPAAVARAQQWLLLSGVSLGIAGSVLIEGLLSWAAHRSQPERQSPSRRTSSRQR